MDLNGFISKKIKLDKNIKEKKKTWEPFRKNLAGWVGCAI